VSVLGKQLQFSFGSTMKHAVKTGDHIHADVCGPMQEPSFSGFRYFVVFKDDFSKYRGVYFRKNENEIANKLKIFLAEGHERVIILWWWGK
jgi:hypothetical protein